MTRPMRSLTELNADIAENEKRRRLTRRIDRLIAKWSPVLGVHVSEWKIQKMKTYWGSANERDRKITFNLTLADMPPAFVEATVVHELVHFLTDGHDAKFYRLMDRYVPGWRRLHARYSEKLTRDS